MLLDALKPPLPRARDRLAVLHSIAATRAVDELDVTFTQLASLLEEFGRPVTFSLVPASVIDDFHQALAVMDRHVPDRLAAFRRTRGVV